MLQQMKQKTSVFGVWERLHKYGDGGAGDGEEGGDAEGAKDEDIGRDGAERCGERDRPIGKAGTRGRGCGSFYVGISVGLSVGSGVT